MMLNDERAALNCAVKRRQEEAARRADKWFERNVGIIDIRNYVFFGEHKAEWIRRYHFEKRRLK